MTVKQIMTEPVLTCSPDTSLAIAARQMSQADCGTIAVVDAHGQLAGIITDRDIALALAESHRNAFSITVHEAMTHDVFTAHEQDDVKAALATMKHRRVRRLPVVDASRRVTGLLSIEDVIVRGLDDKQIGPDDVVGALRTMYVRVPVREPVAPNNGYTPG